MPVTVEITVDDHIIDAIQVARIDRALDRIATKQHQYSTLRKPQLPSRDAEWDTGAMFDHLYGDDVTILASKALTALPKSGILYPRRHPVSVTIRVNERTVKTFHLMAVTDVFEDTPAGFVLYSLIEEKTLPQRDAVWDFGMKLVVPDTAFTTDLVVSALEMLNLDIKSHDLTTE